MRKLVGFVLGLMLFFMVMTVLYFMISLPQEISFEFQALIPLIVFTGFLIFLVAAILIALAIFSKISKDF